MLILLPFLLFVIYLMVPKYPEPPYIETISSIQKSFALQKRIEKEQGN
jgi:hypothetical protein